MNHDMNLSWPQLAELEEMLGDSFFILDVQNFRDNYWEFLSSFRSIYPNTNLAYSYKTNYLPTLCRLVHSMGGYAEVVSQLEYDLALHLGVSPHRTVFNGPLKEETAMERALLAGSVVNLDSPYEIAYVESLARRYPRRSINVGLRCNFDIGASQVSRFGFDIETGELARAFETLERLDNCSVYGLHCHFSTPRTVESYTLRARTLLKLAATHFKSHAPRFIDLGGGFFGRMGEELKSQFEQPVPTYQDYAAAIAPVFAEAFPDGRGPELLLEPGVALVANVMVFVAKIIDIKTVRSRKVALSTGSVHNVKPSLHGKNLPMQVCFNDANKKREPQQGPMDIVGYTCMEPDCLFHGYRGSLALGDYVVFDSVGAYTLVLQPPFMRPAPAIVAYEAASGQYEVVREREEFKTFFQGYVF
jgi:diaminopimelate decarboxylase